MYRSTYIYYIYLRKKVSRHDPDSHPMEVGRSLDVYSSERSTKSTQQSTFFVDFPEVFTPVGRRCTAQPGPTMTGDGWLLELPHYMAYCANLCNLSITVQHRNKIGMFLWSAVDAIGAAIGPSWQTPLVWPLMNSRLHDIHESRELFGFCIPSKDGSLL